MVIAHTDCRMAQGSEDQVHAAVQSAGGPDTRSLSFLTTDDPVSAVRSDVERIRSWPYLQQLNVGGLPLRRRDRPPHAAQLANVPE